MTFKGELEGFPTEIVELMLQRQVEQGNPKNIGVFEEFKTRGCTKGGFDWKASPEDHAFWHKVIFDNDFDLFFEKYPKGVVNEKTQYPKVMLVSNDSDIKKEWKQRVVIKKAGVYVAWANAETLEEAETATVVYVWKYAKDLPEPKIKLTKEALIEKLGIASEDLDIFED